MSTARQYELIYIVPPESTEEALNELHAQILAVVERFHGTIEKTETRATAAAAGSRRNQAAETPRQRTINAAATPSTATAGAICQTRRLASRERRIRAAAAVASRTRCSGVLS